MIITVHIFPDLIINSMEITYREMRVQQCLPLLIHTINNLSFHSFICPK
jgi:hypothetical protein